MHDFLLIELVGQHRTLYDPKNKHYNDQNIKNNVWRAIGDVLKQSSK